MFNKSLSVLCWNFTFYMGVAIYGDRVHSVLFMLYGLCKQRAEFNELCFKEAGGGGILEG